jgi:hypothetical protein
MKRIKIVTLLFFVLSSKLIAGEFSGLGLKLGYISSIFTGKNIPGKGVSSQPGVTIGGFICYEFDRLFSIQQEVLITTKGAKINTIGDVNLSNLFFYFEMPVLAKMTVLSDYWLKPNIYLGPALALFLVAYNNAGALEDIRGYDFGVTTGGSIEIWKVSLDLRLTKGLVNFDESEDELDLKHQTISFLINYAF